MPPTNPIISSNPMAQYEQYGYNTDVSNGYNPTAFDTYSQQMDDAWDAYNKGRWDLFGLRRAKWEENQKIIHDQYQKAYDTAYNNEINTTQRQISAGYNPTFQGGSAGSPASTNNPLDNYSPLENKINTIQTGLSFGNLISSSMTSFMGMAQNLANIKKTNAETQFIEKSTPIKLNNMSEEGFGKWIDNNQSFFSQFPNRSGEDISIFPNLVGQGSYMTPEDDSMLSYQSEIQGLLRDKAKELKENDYWKNMANLLKDREAIYHYDAEKARKFEQYLDETIIPNLVNGIKLDSKQIDLDLKTLELGKGLQYGQQIIRILSNIFGMTNAGRTHIVKYK